MKAMDKAQTKKIRASKPRRTRGPIQREAKEVMAELVAKLSQRLDAAPPSSHVDDVHRALERNRDRLTVGVDLGDKSSLGIPRW
jgi:hypothetical protein